MRILFERETELNNRVKLDLDSIRAIAISINPQFEVHQTSPSNISVLLNEAPVLFVTSQIGGKVLIRRNNGQTVEATGENFEQIIKSELTNYKI